MNIHEQRHFDTIARQAGAAVGWYRTAAGIRRLQRRAVRMARDCGDGPVRVLEIGCGEGAFTQQVKARLHPSALLTSLELSFELVRLARRDVTDLRTQVLQADAERLPFADGTFDVVLGNAILHHVPLATVVPECVRVLKPDGRFVFAEPNLLNPAVFMTKRIPWVKRWLHESPHETAFVRWPLQRELTRLGVEGVMIEPFDFVLPLTPKYMVSSVEWLGRGLERLGGLREVAISLYITGRKPALSRAAVEPLELVDAHSDYR